MNYRLRFGLALLGAAWLTAGVAVAPTPVAAAPPTTATAPASQPTTAPVVAIVFHKLQDTGDKDADAKVNQPIINEMVAKAVELSGGLEGLVKEGQTVLIKPNLTNLKEERVYQPGMTTDVRVVSALVDELQAKTRGKVVIGEGSYIKTAKAYEACGYAALGKAKGVPLIDFVTDTLVPVKRPGLAYPEYRLPKSILDADVVIDAPVLKTHQLTGVSLGLKNWYGLLPPPREYHEKIDQVLADLAQIRKPDLVVVDGLVGMEGQGPVFGTPVPTNVVIAGRDMVAVDAVCSAVMGLDPKIVPHIQAAAQRGLGTADLNRIVLRGNSIDQVKHTFRQALASLHLACPKTDANMKFLVTRCASKEPVIRERQGQEQHLGWTTHWPAEALKIDRNKHPSLTSTGFQAHFYRDSDSIRFDVEYPVLNPEDKQALEQAMKRWIAENMQAAATTRPTTIPALTP